MTDRAARDAARARFNGHFEVFKADINERGIGGRLADEAMEQAKLMFDEAVTVVEEHPGAVGGTLAFLMLWLVRNPLMAWVKDTFDLGSQ
ncbi:hypothetical protein [Novosphingobium barchaimii]|nr:hypothetical protein [Novosphingobium barchaimii]